MTFSLSQSGHSELLIKKSRFIGCVSTVENRAAALQCVQALWQAHPAAIHVCWALLAGGHSAAHDDGEPSGTAGRPMLEVLRHHDLDGVLATVVRYYGGTPLGAGGLVRAYTDSVVQALATTHKIARIVTTCLHCQIPYALEGWLRHALEQFHGELQTVQHQEHVHCSVLLPQDQVHAFTRALQDAGRGVVQWQLASDS